MGVPAGVRGGHPHSPSCVSPGWHPAVHRGGELVSAGAVVGEHVHGGTSRREQHGVARAGELCGRVDDAIHRCSSLPVADLDDGHIGRVSRKRVGDHLPVPAEEYGAAQPTADRLDEVVEARPLGQPARDPHDGLVGLQRAHGGVRVGGLAVVDPGDAVGLGHLRDAVAVGLEGAQPFADGLLRDAVGAGQGGGGQGVGDEVRGGRGEVGDRAELGGACWRAAR